MIPQRESMTDTDSGRHNISQTLIVIVGPTAVGKTTVGIKVASALNTEIVSADSRQVYKEMDIGTAKPSVEERKSTVHHLIDFVPVTDDYNAGKFERDALPIIEQLINEHGTALLVGGSGLYIEAICNGFDEMPPVDESIRQKWKQVFWQDGIAALQEKLKSQDPAYYEVVDQQNPQRLMRALEVIDSSGSSYSSFRKGTRIERPFNIVKVGLNLGREVLYEKIDRRVDEMMEAGLLAEVSAMADHAKSNALNTLGYKELLSHLDGSYTLPDAIDLIKKHTRNFAKRQLTWFNRDSDIKWFQPSEVDEIMGYIRSFSESK